MPSAALRRALPAVMTTTHQLLELGVGSGVIGSGVIGQHRVGLPAAAGLFLVADTGWLAMVRIT